MEALFDTRDLPQHERYLFAYALRRLGDADLAHDLVQDTFVTAIASSTSFRGQSTLRTWLTGILKHKIVDALRDRARTPASLDELTDQGEDGTRQIAEIADDPRSSRDPEYRLKQTRFWAAFREHLERMPSRTAQAFVMSELGGQSAEDVCRTLGVSRTNLWVMLHRARRSLRDALAPAMLA